MKQHNRKSIRLKGYDYTRSGRYFVTIVVRNRQHLFGKIVGGEMRLNCFGEIAQKEWFTTLKKRNNIELGEVVIMPDHVHFIVSIVFPQEQTQYDPSELDRRAGVVAGKDICKEGSLGSIVRGYKAAVTYQIKALIYSQNGLKTSHQRGPDALRPIVNLKKSIWQRNYHDVIIESDRAYNNITNYIKNNPRKWEEDLIKKLNKDD